jgi:demethylmenaquinone methyltransferase/2-methoxy-6-polyprenyl-1,4-benzoquinol methylase
MRELAALPVRGNLLDLGGGTGRVSAALRKEVDAVIVADVSMGMLKQTPRAALEAVCSFSEALPFPDNFFERIIMVDALHHVVDQPATAREMLRVLKPGGRIVIEEPNIALFAVKLIALAEKLLLMRSHFLSAKQIASLFPSAQVSVTCENASAWVVISKP